MQFNNMSYQALIREFHSLRNLKKAQIFLRFFKTGKGEYGEGDKFLGLSVPQQRLLSKKYFNLKLEEIAKLLSDKIHEYRLTALLILIIKYKKSDVLGKKEIFEFYIRNTKYINNWDLVDLSSPNIVGDYLLDKDKKVLYKLAKSNDLWEKRTSIIATYTFIKNRQFEDTLKISAMFLDDKHDLIHKAVGWMLREVGKRDQNAEEKFLKKHFKKMPRTMLRYAIEKFDKDKREFYLNKD